MKATVYTLGCKVNQYESQELITMMKNAGYEITQDNESADICIINSCTVTGESSRKSRQAVRHMRKKNPDAIIVLTGCYSQAFPEEASLINEADIIIGTKTNYRVIELIDKFNSDKQHIVDIVPHDRNDRYKGSQIQCFEGHTRAFIKIQDGCNRYCSYCTIPKAKGFSRSRPLNDIETELKSLAKHGFKEVVFVGINLSAYGLDINKNICDALILAEETDGIERFRLGSLEPDHITDEILKKLSEMKKFCPQFHLSLQSGSDRILKKMNRHYTSEEYLALVNKIKNTFGNASITTDIIVGFPGETDDDFNSTCVFTEKCGFMKVHVFPFSARKGTPAYNYTDKIPNSVKIKRCATLQKKCDAVRKDAMSDLIGRTVSVLFETPKDGIQTGYTENYTPVFVNCNDNLCGKICNVRITDIQDDFCTGEII